MWSDRRLRSPRSIVFATTIGSSAHSLMKGQLGWFRERGWEVTLICSPDDAATAAAEREGVAFIGIPMVRTISLRADARALARWIRVLAAIRPSAVNVGTPKAGLLGILGAWLTRVPVRIYTIRGLRFEGAQGPLRVILWTLEWLASLAATDVVVVSPSLARQVRRLHISPQRKLRLIGEGSSNGVDVGGILERTHATDREALRASLGLTTQYLTVGFIGRVTWDKGVATLLDAMSLMSEPCNLLLIGPSEDAGLARSIQTCTGAVCWIPWTDDVWGHLAAIDVLALPSYREGFPTVVLEAAAAGIPAVTTHATGAVDSVIDGVTGFLVGVGDAEHLAARLDTFARDRRLVERMGRAAQDRAAGKFQQVKIWTGLETIAAGLTCAEHNVESTSTDWSE